MRTLLVEIIAGETVIGAAELGAADPAMGVAYGVFRPGPAYVADLHARASDRRALDTAQAPLSARVNAGDLLRCAGVELEDGAETLGPEGREVWIFGLEDFQSYFD